MRFSLGMQILLGAASAIVPACSVALEDPNPFEAIEIDAEIDAALALDAMRRVRDAFLAPDRGPDAVPDLGPDAAPPDAHPDQAPPDAHPDVAPPPPDACVVSDELCDGRDNDCDGEVDEADPRLCQDCGPPGVTGICARGKVVCHQGELRCVSWLPPAGPAVPCDLLDNDCDGAIDEAGEEVRPAEPQEVAARRLCGDPIPAPGFPDPATECCQAPRVVGCQAVHPCVGAGCWTNCVDQRWQTLATCDQACDAGLPPLDTFRCLAGCRAPVEQAFANCLAACGVDPALQFDCAAGPAGPECSPHDAAAPCPER